MDISFNNNEIHINIDTSIFNIDAIHKCFYWYGDDYSVTINSSSDNSVFVMLKQKNGKIKSDEEDKLIDKINNDLLDFQTRDTVTKETKNIRDLLVAKAFAHSDIYDEAPPGEISDPVGFKV